MSRQVEAFACQECPEKERRQGKVDIQAFGRGVSQGKKNDGRCQGHARGYGGRDKGQSVGGGRGDFDEHALGGNDLWVQIQELPCGKGGEVVEEDVDQEQAEGGENFPGGAGIEDKGNASEDEQNEDG